MEGRETFGEGGGESGLLRGEWGKGEEGKDEEGEECVGCGD